MTTDCFYQSVQLWATFLVIKDNIFVTQRYIRIQLSWRNDSNGLEIEESMADGREL